MMGRRTPAIPVGSRRRAIDRRLAGAYAHDRIATALFDVVVDAVDFGPCRLRTADGREWMREALCGPLKASTEAAIVTLARELDRAFDHAPSEVRGWLNGPSD
jgi:hypothetical protein